MSKLDKDTVLNNFTQAFTKANGKTPTVEAKGGWYSIDGGKNVRLAQLEEMTAELSSAKPAKKADKPVKKEAATAAVAAPVAKKEMVEKKAPAAKKSASKKTAAKTFSVKDFYIEQIKAINSGAKAPR